MTTPEVTGKTDPAIDKTPFLYLNESTHQGGFEGDRSMAKEQWETYFDAVRKEDWKTAKNVLQLIAKQERDNPQTFVKIGDVCQRTGDKTESIAAYTHAAQLLRMQGFAQKALATYKIALRLDPDNPEIIQRAEMLMDEFESAKAAPHIPAPTYSSPPAAESPATASVEELPQPPEETQPAAKLPETSDWLESTAVSLDASGAEKINSAIPAPDIASMFESTSLTTEKPRQQEAVPEPSVPAAAESESPLEKTSFDTVSPQQSEIPASAKTSNGDEGWLESAYEALETRVFKPEAERPSEIAASDDDDAINLIVKQNSGEPAEDLIEEIGELLTPLSERRERTIPEIFRDLPEAMVTNFMNDLTIRKYRDMEHVIEEGDAGDSMYIIRSGKTRVIAHMLGRELELAVLGEGDIFGEVGFLTGRPRTAAVIADGPAEVFEISRLDIEKLIETNPDIMARIEDFYETRVRDTIRKVKS